MSGTVQLVTACGMHRISSSVWSPSEDVGEKPPITINGFKSAMPIPQLVYLPHPRDTIELHERKPRGMR